MNNQNSGFTLIELIIFISVLGFISSSAFITFDNILRLNGSPNRTLQAASLARSRMEIILFSRQNNYASFNDPCNLSTSGICAALNTYATSHSLTVAETTITENSPNKTIVVSVSSAEGNSYPLQARVSNYE